MVRFAPLSKTGVLVYDRVMEKTNYTSPSGVTYEVKPRTQTRTEYRVFMDGSTAYQKEYVQYNIYLNDRCVQFCFNRNDVADTVARYENPGADLGSRFD